MTVERQFDRELEIFRKEAEEATQFFYSYLAIDEVAKRYNESSVCSTKTRCFG